MVDNRKPGLLRVRENMSLREKTVRVLREAILRGHFRPGQRLVERDLCEQTGVSRSSVREALRYLESEGLVESRGTRGMFIPELTSAAALEIYEVRAALESEAARQFAERATSADLKALEKVYAQMVATGGRDSDNYRKETDLFFEVLFEGAHNSIAESIMRSLHARISFLRANMTRLSPLARRRISIQEMGQILRALRARDGATAAAACREFVARSARFAVECLSSQGINHIDVA